MWVSFVKIIVTCTVWVVLGCMNFVVAMGKCLDRSDWCRSHIKSHANKCTLGCFIYSAHIQCIVGYLCSSTGSPIDLLLKVTFMAVGEPDYSTAQERIYQDHFHLKRRGRTRFGIECPSVQVFIGGWCASDCWNFITFYWINQDCWLMFDQWVK